MPVSNPATFFINESETRSFTYEGGSSLFNWSPYDSGLSKSMESNVIFFADSEDHARDVLRRLFEFWIECNEQYLKSRQKSDGRKRISVNDYHGFSTQRRTESATLKYFLRVIDQMAIRAVSPTQLFKVGWACNDDLGVYQMPELTKAQNGANQ